MKNSGVSLPDTEERCRSALWLTAADVLVQATVQATLANLPMDQVQSAYAPTDPAYAENMRWAEEALVTAVFCIIICGAWGTLSIRYLAPFLLQKVRRQCTGNSLDPQAMQAPVI